MNKMFFNAYCIANEISPYMANRIMDVRYKPYLSNLDDLYYGEGLGGQGDPWDAKLKALQAAIRKWGVEEVRIKLRLLS